MAAALLSAAGCATGEAGQSIEATAAPYRLGPGDKLRLTVFGEQAITGEYAVGPDGSVALPLIGNVPARGLTISELQAAIVGKLLPEFILNPRVSVDVSTFRPFYILGEVARPGSYPYVEGLSAAQAVAIAGGYSYRANTRGIYIRRADKQVEEPYTLRGGQQVWVQPGDTLRVGERFF